MKFRQPCSGLCSTTLICCTAPLMKKLLLQSLASVSIQRALLMKTLVGKLYLDLLCLLNMFFPAVLVDYSWVVYLSSLKSRICFSLAGGRCHSWKIESVLWFVWLVLFTFNLMPNSFFSLQCRWTTKSSIMFTFWTPLSLQLRGHYAAFLRIIKHQQVLGSRMPWNHSCWAQTSSLLS